VDFCTLSSHRAKGLEFLLDKCKANLKLPAIFHFKKTHNNVVRRKIRAEKIKSSLNPGGLET
jgi:predicted nucleotide-binding protein (sugar kinase/HSP70/actin superfamily)